jgi:hypothetical protein
VTCLWPKTPPRCQLGSHEELENDCRKEETVAGVAPRNQGWLLHTAMNLGLGHLVVNYDENYIVLYRATPIFGRE